MVGPKWDPYLSMSILGGFNPMLLYCNQTHPNSTYCLAIVSHFILIIWIIQGIDNNERTLNNEDVGVVRTT